MGVGGLVRCVCVCVCVCARARMHTCVPLCAHVVYMSVVSCGCTVYCVGLHSLSNLMEYEGEL